MSRAPEQSRRRCRLLLVRAAGAEVLPDNRADLFYSKYSGGGMDITGESVLVRKKFTEKFAVEGNYFIDKVSGASIDVLSQASVIKDERKQKSAARSSTCTTRPHTPPRTPTARSATTSRTQPHFSLSQDMFGDLTTVTLGFADTRDKVGENNGTAKVRTSPGWAMRRAAPTSGGLSQILTKNFIAGVNLEVITDQGLLWQPLSLDSLSRPGRSEGLLAGQPDISRYPHQHRGETRVKYYLPYRAAASRSYRYFSDTWGIAATPSNWITPIPSATNGSSKDGFATTSQNRRRSTATFSRS